MDLQTNKQPEDLMYLQDENGDQMAFRFLDLIYYEEKEYIILQAAEGPYAGEAVILQRERGEIPGEESYADVEDPKVIRAVYELFKERFQDQFIFED